MKLRWNCLRTGQRREKDYSRILFIALMAVGIAVRVACFGTVPGDINQDEAFAGYNAYSMLRYGIDSAGYRFPVYLFAWGSGMSALNTYLMMPFMALFGPQIWVIRMPQLIVAVLTLWVAYLLMRELFHEKIALLALFLLAVCPWHVMMSRWGLDANLAPGFLIFGLYFYVRGLKCAKFLMLSALMYGLSLYCYAPIWAVVPFLVLCEFLYGLYVGKIRMDRWALFSVLILGAMALPLILFLLVNLEVIGEVKLPFLSMPKLVGLRDGELTIPSLQDLAHRAKILWSLMKAQYDYIPADATERYGIYYKGTLPFFLLGAYLGVRKCLKGLWKREHVPECLLLFQVVGGIALGLLLVRNNIYRNNILFIPMVLIAALGIYGLFEMVDIKEIALPILYYLVLFVGFTHYYFTEYSAEMDYYFCRGLQDAVEDATSSGGPIYYSQGIAHSSILFLARVPAQEFIDTVEYYVYPHPYLEAKSFGRFRCDFDVEKPDRDVTYILNKNVDWAFYEAKGFDVRIYGEFAVARHPDNANE